MSDVEIVIRRIKRFPRKNGLPTFSAPWQSRVFGVALAISAAGRLEWKEFDKLLDPTIDLSDIEAFYGQWLDALTEIIVSNDLITEAELEAREQEFIRQEREV